MSVVTVYEDKDVRVQADPMLWGRTVRVERRDGHGGWELMRGVVSVQIFQTVDEHKPC